MLWRPPVVPLILAGPMEWSANRRDRPRSVDAAAAAELAAREQAQQLRQLSGLAPVEPVCEDGVDRDEVIGRRGTKPLGALVGQHRVRHAPVGRAGGAFDQAHGLEAVEQAGDARWREHDARGQLDPLEAPVRAVASLSKTS